MRAKTNNRKIVTIAQMFIFRWRFIYRSRFGCLSFPLKNLKTAFLWDDLGQDQLSRFMALQRNRQIRSGKRFIGSIWCNMIRAIYIVNLDGDHPEGTHTKKPWRPQQQQRCKFVIWLVEWRRRIVLHVRHAFHYVTTFLWCLRKDDLKIQNQFEVLTTTRSPSYNSLIFFLFVLAIRAW